MAARLRAANPKVEESLVMIPDPHGADPHLPDVARLFQAVKKLDHRLSLLAQVMAS